jgi:hypothetical protein
MKVQGEVVLAEDNLISCSFVSQVLLWAREKPSIKNPFNVTACSTHPLPSLKQEKKCAEVRRWLESNPGFLLTEAYLPVDIFKHSIRANGREVWFCQPGDSRSQKRLIEIGGTLKIRGPRQPITSVCGRRRDENVEVANLLQDIWSGTLQPGTSQ